MAVDKRIRKRKKRTNAEQRAWKERSTKKGGKTRFIGGLCPFCGQPLTKCYCQGEEVGVGQV